MTAVPPPPTTPGLTMRPISCAFCYCLHAEHNPAVTTIDGYSCCLEHAEFMARPLTDFAELVQRLKTNATENAT